MDEDWLFGGALIWFLGWFNGWACFKTRYDDHFEARPVGDPCMEGGKRSSHHQQVKLCFKHDSSRHDYSPAINTTQFQRAKKTRRSKIKIDIFHVLCSNNPDPVSSPALLPFLLIPPTQLPCTASQQHQLIKSPSITHHQPIRTITSTSRNTFNWDTEHTHTRT